MINKSKYYSYIADLERKLENWDLDPESKNFQWSDEISTFLPDLLKTSLKPFSP